MIKIETELSRKAAAIVWTGSLASADLVCREIVDLEEAEQVLAEIYEFAQMILDGMQEEI